MTSMYAETVAPYAAALAMVREAIGDLFGPIASIESEDASLLRGPEPHHDAEAIIAALQRVRSALETSPAAQETVMEDMVERAHKAQMSELFLLCQPDNGDVFSFMDDRKEVMRAALTAALSSKGA